MGGHLAIGDQDLPFRFERAIDVVKPAGGGGEVIEGGGKSGLVHVNRSDAAGDIAGLDDGVLEQFVNLGRGLRLGLEALGEIVPQGAGDAGDAGKILAEAVVQIRADALLLALAGADDVALEFPQPAHIREPGLHAVAPGLDGRAADCHEG